MKKKHVPDEIEEEFQFALFSVSNIFNLMGLFVPENDKARYSTEVMLAGYLGM